MSTTEITTEEQREQAFLEAMREAERKFGCTAIAITYTEKLGEAVLVKTGIQIRAIAGWKPPEPESAQLADAQFAHQLLEGVESTRTIVAGMPKRKPKNGHTESKP